MAKDEDRDPRNRPLPAMQGQQAMQRRQQMGAGDPGGNIQLDPYSRAVSQAQPMGDPSRYNQAIGLGPQMHPLGYGQRPSMGNPAQGQPPTGGANPFMQALAAWHARQQQGGAPGQGPPQFPGQGQQMGPGGFRPPMGQMPPQGQPQGMPPQQPPQMPPAYGNGGR